MISQRELRAKDPYLTKKYSTYVNYDDYFVLEKENNQIKIKSLQGALDINEIRDKTSYQRSFLDNKQLALNVLYKRLEENHIIYLPGSIDFRNTFYQHPILLDSILLTSLKEYKFPSDTGIEIEFSAYFDSKPKTYLFTIPNHKGIYYSEIVLSRVISARKIGIPLERFKKNLSIINDYNTNINRIFKFIDQLKFKEWSEVVSRPGADNRMDSGRTVYNIPNDLYLKHLMNVPHNESVLNFYDDPEYGYVPSKKYNEVEIEGLHIKHKILIDLIKNYDQEMDFVYAMLDNSIEDTFA